LSDEDEHQEYNGIQEHNLPNLGGRRLPIDSNADQSTPVAFQHVHQQRLSTKPAKQSSKDAMDRIMS
jgi:hypothetical protein